MSKTIIPPENRQAPPDTGGNRYDAFAQVNMKDGIVKFPDNSRFKNVNRISGQITSIDLRYDAGSAEHQIKPSMRLLVGWYSDSFQTKDGATETATICLDMPLHGRPAQEFTNRLLGENYPTDSAIEAQLSISADKNDPARFRAWLRTRFGSNVEWRDQPSGWSWDTSNNSFMGQPKIVKFQAPNGDEMTDSSAANDWVVDQALILYQRFNDGEVYTGQRYFYNAKRRDEAPSADKTNRAMEDRAKKAYEACDSIAALNEKHNKICGTAEYKKLSELDKKVFNSAYEAKLKELNPALKDVSAGGGDDLPF